MGPPYIGPPLGFPKLWPVLMYRWGKDGINIRLLESPSYWAEGPKGRILLFCGTLWGSKYRIHVLCYQTC